MSSTHFSPKSVSTQPEPQPQNNAVSGHPDPTDSERGFLHQWGADRHIDPALLALNTAPWGGIDDVASEGGQELLHTLLEWLESFKPYDIGSHGRSQYVTGSVNRLAAKYSSEGFFIEGIDPATGQPSGDRQLRLQHPPEDGPKYLRPSGGVAKVFFARVTPEVCGAVAARYGVDEVPTPEEFWHWVKAHKIPVVLAEGAGDALGALSNGWAAVGTPGYNMCWVRGTRQLKPELEWLAEGGGCFFIALDQDHKPQTIIDVNRERAKVGKVLSARGCKVSVALWNHSQGKGFGDLSASDQDKAIADAIGFALWRVRGYTLLTCQPSLEVNQRYLRVEYPKNFLTLVRSAKGTGKTEALIKAVQQAHDEGRRVLLLTHRVQLGQAICNRVGLPYITEVRTAGEGSLLGYGLCVDSLHPLSQARFSGEDWRDALVIVDEVEQVLWHLLDSSTCKRQRAVIISQFVQVLQGAGQVIALDADLSDVTVNFLQKVTGHEPYLILNAWQPSGDEAWVGYLYEKPLDLLQKLDQDLRQHRRCFVQTQAQKPKSSYGTINLEKHVLRAWPEARVLRVDSDTVSDPNHPAFGCIGSLNTIAGDYDVIIASPSIETGVSIDIRGHFEGVYAFLSGQTPENTARQALDRVREPIPRYIWAATYGASGIVQGGDLSPYALTQKLGARAKTSLQQLGWDEDTDCLDLHSDCLDLWAKMAARINGGLVQFRDTLSHNLRAEGHQIYRGEIDTGADSTPLKVLQNEVTDTRNQSWDEECEAVAGSDPISDSEASKRDKSRALTAQQRRELRKHKLEKLYGIEATPDLVRADDEGLFPRLRLQYYLTLGREHLTDRDKGTAETMLENGNGKAWLPDFTGSMLGVKIKVLEALGLTQWLSDPDREFRSTDEDLKIWTDRAIGCRQQIKRLLGVSLSPSLSPVRVLHRLLGTIGVDLRCFGRDKVDGKAGNRVYRLVPSPDFHADILQAWLTQDQDKAQKADPLPTQTQTPQAVEGDLGGADTGSTTGNRSYIQLPDPLPTQTQPPQGLEPDPMEIPPEPEAPIGVPYQARYGNGVYWFRVDGDGRVFSWEKHPFTGEGVWRRYGSDTLPLAPPAPIAA